MELLSLGYLLEHQKKQALGITSSIYQIKSLLQRQSMEFRIVFKAFDLMVRVA